MLMSRVLGPVRPRPGHGTGHGYLRWASNGSSLLPNTEVGGGSQGDSLGLHLQKGIIEHKIGIFWIAEKTTLQYHSGHLRHADYPVVIRIV